jgi:hypothetical protein
LCVGFLLRGPHPFAGPATENAGSRLISGLWNLGSWGCRRDLERGPRWRRWRRFWGGRGRSRGRFPRAGTRIGSWILPGGRALSGSGSLRRRRCRRGSGRDPLVDHPRAAGCTFFLLFVAHRLVVILGPVPLPLRRDPESR